MKICLIDADSTIPNLALMKLSTYHKNKGDEVTLLKAKLPYYPNRKKKYFNVPDGYDTIYCSVVFDNNKDFIGGDNIIFGGSGYSLDINLPYNIENLLPDYSMYPDNDISYGFLSRGCIRNCKFCIVPRKEGGIKQVSTINDIVRHKKVKFLDNNFLALPNHKQLLKELIATKVKCQFCQGLDIRLVDEENSKLLSKLNYINGEYIFAFDDISLSSLIDKKLKLLDWRKPFRFKFFVYCHPDTGLKDICERIEWLRSRRILPYVMRDISCWESEYSHFYMDISAYCNQPNFFKRTSFIEFLHIRYKNKDRIEYSNKLYEDNKPKGVNYD